MDIFSATRKPTRRVPMWLAIQLTDTWISETAAGEPHRWRCCRFRLGLLLFLMSLVLNKTQYHQNIWMSGVPSTDTIMCVHRRGKQMKGNKLTLTKNLLGIIAWYSKWAIEFVRLSKDEGMLMSSLDRMPRSWSATILMRRAVPSSRRLWPADIGQRT